MKKSDIPEINPNKYGAEDFDSQSEWISIEDELPQEDGKYLIITPDGYIKLIQYYEHHGGTFFGGVIATHWMPLPKPPIQ